MCDIMREVKEEGIAEGRRVGLAEGIERGRTAGLAEGKQAGLAEGKQVGIAEGIEQTIVQMYKRGKLSKEEACESLGCTPEQFVECVEKYEKQD